MPKAVIIESFGGPEVLKIVNADLSAPQPNQVQIRHTAIDVNFLDILQRKGLAGQSGSGLNVPGLAAVGVIERVGSKVDGFNEGEKVGYLTKGGGAYSDVRNINVESIFALPYAIDDKIMASCLVKGLTAHYLCNRSYMVKPNMGVIVHSAASGVGKLLSQWCKGLGAFVFGTVGSDEKKQIALDNGCDVVYNYNTEDWVKGIRGLTKDIGVHVVYDSVGDALFDKSLTATMNMGVIISYGSSSGPVKSIDIDKIKARSLIVTMPSLFHYKATRKELLLSVDELFSIVLDGSLQPSEPAVFKLDDVVSAHKLAEDRLNSNPIVLVP
jgi:NADPH2:quinone reductase